MKYVDQYTNESEKKESQTFSYGKNGEIVTDSKDTVYAKYTAVDLNGRTQKKFFVLTANGGLFDPMGTDSHRERTIRKELRSTSKQTFDYYVNYLKTKSGIILRRAERSFVDG
jgi:hypothetical protein